MDMLVNKDTVRKLRLEKSWSQEKLAEAASLNLRTLQRIEKDGVASLRSCEALAMALGVEPQELRKGLAAESSPSSAHVPHAAPGPALSILAAVLMLWGVAQMATPVYGFDVYQSSTVSFLFLCFAAFVLLTFFTRIVDKRLYVLAGCVVLALFVSPPSLIAQVQVAVPLVLLFELSAILAKRFSACR
jgi:transcriptional regulator with XRE-family HTH domain